MEIKLVSEDPESFGGDVEWLPKSAIRLRKHLGYCVSSPLGVYSAVTNSFCRVPADRKTVGNLSTRRGHLRFELNLHSVNGPTKKRRPEAADTG